MNFQSILEKTQSTRDKFRDQIDQMRRDLDALRNEVGADVIAFYLACDPFLPYLRCMTAPGARYEDACSHFRLRPLDPAVKDEDFFEIASTDPLCSKNQPRVITLIDRRRMPIFGDFVTREGIASRGRMLERDPHSGKETALLTVNYREARSEDRWRPHASRLKEVFRDILGRAAVMQRAFQEISEQLKPAYQGMLEVTDLSHPDSLPASSQFLNTILERAISPLGDGFPWCGTIHQLDRTGRTLELKARAGEPVDPPLTRHRIDRGEGVITWVALREQAVRIRDLPRSPFNAIHVAYLPGVRSQLAVPMMTHGQLLGTLSLESTQPDVFSFQTVGYLTRVASLVASALLLAKYEEVKYDRDCYLAALYEQARQRPLDTSLSLEDLEQMMALGSSTPP